MYYLYRTELSTKVLLAISSVMCIAMYRCTCVCTGKTNSFEVIQDKLAFLAFPRELCFFQSSCMTSLQLLHLEYIPTATANTLNRYLSRIVEGNLNLRILLQEYASANKQSCIHFSVYFQYSSHAYAIEHGHGKASALLAF